MSILRFEELRSEFPDSLIKSVAIEKLAEIRGGRVPVDTEFDVFLSYRTEDRAAAMRLYSKLSRYDLSVYLDCYVDPELDPSAVTTSTAEKLRLRMSHSLSLLFVTSRRAASSNWMPWELGYCDGSGKRVAILPALRASEYTGRFTFKGQEYLGLYPWVDENLSTANDVRLWVNETPTKYIDFSFWLSGSQPCERGKVAV